MRSPKTAHRAVQNSNDFLSSAGLALYYTGTTLNAVFVALANVDTRSSSAVVHMPHSKADRELTFLFFSFVPNPFLVPPIEQETAE